MCRSESVHAIANSERAREVCGRLKEIGKGIYLEGESAKVKVVLQTWCNEERFPEGNQSGFPRGKPDFCAFFATKFASWDLFD